MAEIARVEVSRPLLSVPPLSLIEVNLFTGRHHQIRVQLANQNIPIYGDTKYNEKFKRPKSFVNIALWSSYISFYYKPLKKELCFESKPFEFDKAIFNNLEKFELPKEVYFLDAFDETKTGKVNRMETLKKVRTVR